jgi:hypothetical protein
MAPLGPCSRVGVVLALLALLLAQGVGLAHRVWHDTGHHAAAALSGAHEDCGHEAGQESGHAERHAEAHAEGHAFAGGPAFSPFAGLFHGHDEGSAECRLLDQLTHADALVGGAILASANLAPTAPNGAAPCPAARGSIAAYLARAPPRLAAATPAAHTG